VTQAVIHGQSKAFVKERPEIRSGYTVRVHERIQEGEKERVQVFEGLVIAVHHGHVPTDRSFTLRRTVSGVGVEKVYALHSPRIERVEVRKIAKVRRARLMFLRRISGKASRLQERLITSEESHAKEHEEANPLSSP